MTDTDLRLRHQPAQKIGHGVDRLHPVMDEIDLTATAKFAQDRITDQIIVEAGDVGADRLAIDRRRVDNRQAAQSGQAQVQSAGYRRRGQGQDINLGAHLLQPFLVGHAEALLFVDHDQAKVFEPQVTLQQAVGANQDIHLSCGGARDDPFLFRR